MPYIIVSERYRILAGTKQPENAGELNYLLTTICKDYFYNTTKNYQAINDVIGALSCVASEFTRRIVVDYEDKKIKENGDVYTEVKNGRE